MQDWERWNEYREVMQDAVSPDADLLLQATVQATEAAQAAARKLLDTFSMDTKPVEKDEDK